jgi:hypothetical protein
MDVGTDSDNSSRAVSIDGRARRTAIQFLTKVGQTCTDLRQEFILLSDVCGLSALVDCLNHPVNRETKATEATVLGPFFVEDSKNVSLGQGSCAQRGLFNDIT